MTDPRSLPESSRDVLAAALRYAAGRTQVGAARDDATRKAAALPICQDCGRPHWTAPMSPVAQSTPNSSCETGCNPRLTTARTGDLAGMTCVSQP